MLKKLLISTIILALAVTPVYAGKPSSSSSSKSGWGGGSSSSSSKSGWGGSSSSKSTSSSSKSGWGGGSSKQTATKPTATTNSSTQSGWGGSGTTTLSNSRKPTTPSYDSIAITEARKAESRVNYDKSRAPAPAYKTPKGNEVKIDPKDKEIDNLRSRLDHSQWVNRQQRQSTFYGPYSGPSYPVVIYSDPYHYAMHYWLLSQSLDTTAMFIHNHQSMDQARIRDLYARNAALEAKVNALNGQAVDPTWLPPGADPDLFYDDNYVDAAYNPQPKTYQTAESAMIWKVVKWIAIVIGLIIATFVLGRIAIYFLFQKRYGA